MRAKENRVLNQSTEDQPVQKEKLPYVKPELHHLDMDNTEGKFGYPFEITTAVKSGPS